MLRHSGIGTYLQGLLGEYHPHPFFKGHSLELALFPSAISEMNGKFHGFPFYAPVYSPWEQLEYPFRLGRCRLWHAPHYNVALLRKSERLVVTVHDLIHWIFRREFFSSFKAGYSRIFFERVVESADRIITVSESTRNDLICYFKAVPDRIRVIYEGVEKNFFEAPDPSELRRVQQKYGLPERFFLYVGLIKPHKNLKRLLEVFKDLRGKRKSHSALVIVGKKDRRYPKGYESLGRLETGEGIHYIPRLESRGELAAFYRSARALVHPSLYEGFGLTCLEAMASGTPVIVSKTASLPEVAGEAGYYVDPQSNDSIARALLEMEENDSLRNELAAKGQRRAREFSWAKTAQETIRVYEELLG